MLAHFLLYEGGQLWDNGGENKAIARKKQSHPGGRRLCVIFCKRTPWKFTKGVKFTTGTESKDKTIVDTDLIHKDVLNGDRYHTQDRAVK